MRVGTQTGGEGSSLLTTEDVDIAVQQWFGQVDKKLADQGSVAKGVEIKKVENVNEHFIREIEEEKRSWHEGDHDDGGGGREGGP